MVDDRIKRALRVPLRRVPFCLALLFSGDGPGGTECEDGSVEFKVMRWGCFREFNWDDKNIGIAVSLNARACRPPASGN